MRLKLSDIQHSQLQKSYQHRPSSLIYKAIKTLGIVSLMYQSGSFDYDNGRGAISTSNQFYVSATKIEQRLSTDLSQKMTNQEKLMAFQKTSNHEEIMMQSEQELTESSTEQNGEQEKEKTATLSQETIDAAAQVTTDEAGSDTFKSMSVEDLQSSLAEANLLKQLENQEIEQGSSVDATLQEIQKLHVIEDELVAKQDGGAKKPKDKIDQNLIELQTLSKVKSSGGKNDRSAIEAMVEKQVEDQANQIEDTQTLQQSMEILQYGEEIDQKDIVNEVVQSQQTQQVAEDKNVSQPKDQGKKNSTEDSEIDNSNEGHAQSQAALEDVTIKQIQSDKKVVPKEPLQPSKESYKLDLGGSKSFVKAVKKAQKPKSQTQKIEDVVKKSIEIKKKDDKAVDAAKDLFKAKAVPKAKKALAQKNVTANATKNVTTHLNKTHNTTQKKNVTKKVNHTQAESVKKNVTSNHTKNVTEHHKINATQLHQKNSTVNHTQNVTQDHKKNVTHNNTKNVTSNHTKNATQDHKKNSTHVHKKKEKSEEQIEHESGQLDNLFLTLRESLVTDTIIVEEKHHNTSKSHTKKHLHHKGKGHKKAKKSKKPAQASFLMLDSNEKQQLQVDQTIAEKVNQQVNQKVHQKAQTKTKTKSKTKDQDQDLDVNESADLALKKMTKNAIDETTKENNAGKEQKETTDTAKTTDTKTETKEELPESDSVDDKKQDAATATLEPTINNEKQNEEKEFEKIQKHEEELQKKFKQKTEEPSESKESQPETKEAVKEEEDETPAPPAMKDEEKKDLGQYQYVLDLGTRRLIEENDVEQDLKNLEKKPTETKPAGMKEGTPIPRLSMISLINEAEVDTDLTSLEKKQNRPPSDSFVQLGVMSQLSAQAGAQAQIQAMIQTRALANNQAQAAIQSLAKLGVGQKTQVLSQDANLIAALQKTIGQMQTQQAPVSAAQAKKKAVNNIQKALTKKILTRLDDTQPLVNVFSKMQSLSKMMPQIQDFERRLGILHQVEPILENAINTLNKVVDLSSPMGSISLPKLQEAPAPPPPPPPPPAAPGIDQLKQLLANAQAQQAAAAAPAPEPAEEEDPLAALLGGGLGGLAAAAPAPAPEPAADPMAGLESLLGGAGMAAPAPAAPAADPMAALLGGASLGGGDTGDLLSKLLGGGI